MSFEPTAISAIGCGASVSASTGEAAEISNNRSLARNPAELKKIAKTDTESKGLMTIPGVGPLSAVAVKCWLGILERFANGKKLSRHFGLAPRVRQSTAQERHGHITHEGNRLVRSLLIQAALWHVRLGKGSSRKHYLGVLKRRGRHIARVAAANKLLGIIFQRMKERIDYQEFLRRGGNAQ